MVFLQSPFIFASNISSLRHSVENPFEAVFDCYEFACGNSYDMLMTTMVTIHRFINSNCSSTEWNGYLIASQMPLRWSITAQLNTADESNGLVQYRGEPKLDAVQEFTISEILATIMNERLNDSHEIKSYSNFHSELWRAVRSTEKGAWFIRLNEHNENRHIQIRYFRFDVNLIEADDWRVFQHLSSRILASCTSLTVFADTMLTEFQFTQCLTCVAQQRSESNMNTSKYYFVQVRCKCENPPSVTNDTFVRSEIRWKKCCASEVIREFIE